jgi:hypothetical protein
MGTECESFTTASPAVAVAVLMSSPSPFSKSAAVTV